MKIETRRARSWLRGIVCFVGGTLMSGALLVWVLDGVPALLAVVLVLSLSHFGGVLISQLTTPWVEAGRHGQQ